MVVENLAITDPIGRICVLRSTYEEFKGPIDIRLITWLMKIGSTLRESDIRYLLRDVPDFHLQSLAVQLQSEIASEDFRELLPPVIDPDLENFSAEFTEYSEPEPEPPKTEPIEFIGIDPETQAEILQQMEAA